MVSYFQIMLSIRNVSKHTKKVLWQYQLSEQEFHQLKNLLLEARYLANVDPRDCTLYFAEWWKRYYNGGYPSKKQVFGSITNKQVFNEEEFYDYAKKGATMLGIQWLRTQNTLYFKTLLLQGGLPINHMANNKGAYKKFLLEILALNPSSITDFSFDTSITSILPPTSRNDEIYECCLNIVKAIIIEDRDYLRLLEGNAELEDIRKELNIKKAEIPLGRKKASIRIGWILDTKKQLITLYLAIPEALDVQTFNNFFFSEENETQLKNEYKLLYNDTLICKFIRLGNGQMRILWINRIEIVWTPEINHSNLKLLDSQGVQHICNHAIAHFPDLSKATLWSNYSEFLWYLEKGNHTEKENACILFPNTWSAAETNNCDLLCILGHQMRWIEVQNHLTLYCGELQCHFKVHSKKIDWYIVDESPDWMSRQNITVVRKKPKIFVYTEKGNLIPDPVLKWRRHRNEIWSDWHGATLPKGYIELNIIADGVTEHDSIFNIGDLLIEQISSGFSEANIKLRNNDFIFTITENRFIRIEKIDQDTFSIFLTGIDQILPEIKINLKSSNHDKSLTFEMLPPFKGVEIIDNQRIIIRENSLVTLDALQGFRLLANMDGVVINMYNTARQGISIVEKLNNTITPLRAFEDNFKQLYTFSDAMDLHSEVAFEIAVERQGRYSKIKEYKVKRYEDILEWVSGEDREIIIATKLSNNADLFAVPLDSDSETLCLYWLKNHGGIYSLQSENNLKVFIIFSSKDSPVRVRPTIVNIAPINEVAIRSTENERYLKLKETLLNGKFTDDIWKRVLDYYQICRNNDLAFAAFEVLKVTASWSSLSARLFVLLISYCDDELFIEEASSKIEYDLGFSFHWITKDDWASALEWIGCIDNKEQYVLVIAGIRRYFNQLHPSEFFDNICNYILQDAKPRVPSDYHVNSKISNLRSSLGERVLNQLPNKCPEISDLYKDILPVTEANYNVKPLLRSPVAVALSIAGKNFSLWGIENETVRRNIKYCQQLDPTWYSESICYCLNKI